MFASFWSSKKTFRINVWEKSLVGQKDCVLLTFFDISILSKLFLLDFYQVFIYILCIKTEHGVLYQTWVLSVYPK